MSSTKSTCFVHQFGIEIGVVIPPFREQALDHTTVHMVGTFGAMEASPQDSKITEGMELDVTEMTELQSGCGATEVDINSDTKKTEIHEIEEKYEIDELVCADAGFAVENGVSEEAKSSESEADACSMEEEEDLPEVQDSDVTTGTVEVVENVEDAHHAEGVENIDSIWIAPNKTRFLAAWLEESAYWEDYGGTTWYLERLALRRWNTI